MKWAPLHCHWCETGEHRLLINKNGRRMCSECFKTNKENYPDLEEADSEDDLDSEAARDPREDHSSRDQDEDAEQPGDEGEDRSDDERTESPTEI